MKKYALEFVKRGLVAASGGPAVLAIVYGILGASGVIDSLAPGQVCTGILTVTLMAFLAAGVSVVYQIERLPLLHATLIHACTLYLDYLLVYFLNAWIPQSLMGICIFTGIFIAGYALIWLGIILTIKANTARINKKLRGGAA